MKTITATIPFALLNCHKQAPLDFEERLSRIGLELQRSFIGYEKDKVRFKLFIKNNLYNIEEIIVDCYSEYTRFQILFQRMSEQKDLFFTPAFETNKRCTPFWEYCFDIIAQMKRQINLE